MADENQDFMYVSERRLPYKTFDADNHMYETPEALTKFVPRDYDGIIKYVEVNGRTKLAIGDMVSDYIPNPTFARVAVPGGFGEDVTRGGDGVHRTAGDPNGGQRVRAMPGRDAFFDPEPRLALMKDMGIDRTLLWPTLASVVEERLADDPDAACVVVHALNEWMHEHWSFVYSDAIFATPIISLARARPGDGGAGVHRRAWRQDLLDPRCSGAHVERPPSRSRLTEFDPFWEEGARA